MSSTQPRPDRKMGELERSFWAFCEGGELRLQRCSDCGTHLWPPAPVCDGCLGGELQWTPVSGRGTIVSHTVLEREYFPECPPPWRLILVELEEGVWFVSNPHEFADRPLRIGDPVALAFVRCRDRHGDFNLPVFAPR